jgi:hypothetical protein
MEETSLHHDILADLKMLEDAPRVSKNPEERNQKFNVGRRPVP